MAIKDIILNKIAAKLGAETLPYQELVDSAQEHGELTEDQTLNDVIADKVLKPKRGQAIKILRAIIEQGGTRI